MTRLLTEQLFTIQEQKNFLHCLSLEMKVLAPPTHPLTTDRSTQSNIQEDSNLQRHRCENLSNLVQRTVP
jgi:hypothetical protein